MEKLKAIGFWVIQCTWGIITTVIGAIATLALIIMGKKPEHIGPVVCTEIGHGWGGVTLGGFVFVGKNSHKSLKLHECGHTLQNLVFGPLFPFIVAIPSATRYWLRECPNHLKKSLFNLVYLVITLFTTTVGAIIFGPMIEGFKWATIICEVLRLYFLLISIWMSAIEIPRYDKGPVNYYSIWFERQASEWGEKVFDKYPC